MSGVWLPPGKQRFVDPLTGDAMVAGLVYHYIPGTDTPKDTWADEAQTVLNTNPIVLDGEGECTIWGDGLYRQVLQRANTSQVWDEVTGFAGGGGGSVNFATPGQVAAGVATDLVISPYALANSGVLTIPYASAPEVLAGVINNKAVTPFSLANSGVIPLKATAAEVAALVNDTKFITPKALGDSGVLGGGGSSAIVALTQFGWIGDGVTDNAPFFAAMLASASWDMYVPTGIFYVSGASTTLRAQMIKRFWGPGRFLFDDGYCLPGRYSNIGVPPTLWPTQGVTGWFHGQTESVEGEWHVMGPLVRESVTARYFEGAVIPHNIWYDVGSGASGMLSRAVGALVAGMGSAQLISVDGITAGQVLGVTPYGQDGAVTDTITVDTVNAGTKTITFHPNLTTNYPNSVPDGGLPGLATFFAGKRTWAGAFYGKVTADVGGGGDVYWMAGRMQQNYIPKAGQIHCFNTGTVGIGGGEINFGASSGGTYATGWENQAHDHGADVAYIAFVDSFDRTNETGARSVFWGGHAMQSGGTRSADVAYLARGRFRWGTDFSLATLDDTSSNVDPINAGTNFCKLPSVAAIFASDTIGFCDAAGNVLETLTVSSAVAATKVVSFTTNFAFTYPAGRRVVLNRGGGAMNLALGQHAIVFNSTSSANARSGDPTLVYGPSYGNVTGDMVLRSGLDTTSDFWAIQFRRDAPNNSRLTGRPDGISTSVSITSSGSFLGAGDVVCGPAGRLGFGIGSGFYFIVIAGHIYATIDGGGSFGLIR